MIMGFVRFVLPCCILVVLTAAIRGRSGTRRGKKRGCAAGFLVVVVSALICLHRAWNYFGLPEIPDRREYKTIEERAGRALAFAKRHGMSDHYAFFVDYGIPSGTPRFFVWDFQRKRIIASTYVMHGSGGGSTDEQPRFSNSPGSECSSLGRFLVTKEHGSRLKRSFRLKGMDIDNQSAYTRGLMIHSARWVDKWCWKKYIPLNRTCCMGCVTVSSRGMEYLWPLVNKELKPILLWNFENKNE